MYELKIPSGFPLTKVINFCDKHISKQMYFLHNEVGSTDWKLKIRIEAVLILKNEEDAAYVKLMLF